MKRYRWDDALHRALSTILAPFHFREVASLSFIRDAPTCTQILNLGGHAQNGAFKFSCMLGIRYPEVESRLRPDNHDQSYPTVVVPFHFLYESKAYFEWSISKPEQLETVAKSAVEEIMRLASPFFERFSSLDSVEKVLKSSEPFRTFVISPHQRIGILAAIAMQKGHVDEARAIVGAAFSEKTNDNLMPRHKIEEISQRLFSN